MSNTYSLQNVARILKVAPSRLRYWKRTRLAAPRARERALELDPDALVDPDGTAGAFDYDFRDLVGIKAVLSLLEQGISLRRIRRNVEILRQSSPEIEDPLVALRVWGESAPRMIVEKDGHWMEPDGQMLLSFDLEAAAAQGAVSAIDGSGEEAALAELPRDASPDDPVESAGAHFERGCRLDSEPETYEEAAAAYRRALELDPEFADAHCNLGAVFYNRGEREAARRHFERTLRLDPGHVEAHFNLANLLEEDGCNEMALHHYRAGLLADPFYPDLHINIALLCEKMERPEKACDHWRRYLQLAPDGSWSEVAKLRLEREGN